MKNKNNTITETECLQCGNKFRPRLEYVLIGKGKFCSRKCSAVHRWDNQKVKKNCQVCGTQFHAYRKKMIFCSRKCAHIMRPPRLNPDRQIVHTRRKMAAFCCKVIGRCMRSKSDRTYRLLGYTAEELRIHLQSLFQEGMNWSNYGHTGKVWHIDHKKPISSFSPDANISVINALSNLQPMWAVDNFKKSNKIL